MSIIGQRIAILRQRSNLSQEKLADLLSTGRSTIIRYETGKTLPNSDVIVRLCSLFHVSADYLLGISDSYDNSQVLISAEKINTSSFNPLIQEEIKQYIDQAVEQAIKRLINT